MKVESVAYMRCSGTSQTEGDTWDRQISAITSCCDSKELQLLREYREEAVPGKLGEESRPAFQRMVSDLLGNGCRIIVVESLDRLARAYDIQQQLATYLASKGLTLISANTGEDITAALMGDPMRRALVQIQGIFSELDKNLLIAKLKKARDRKKIKTGRCEGRVPFGMKDGESETLWEMQCARRHDLSYDAIADMLNATNTPTRMGKQWRGTTVARILKRDPRCDTSAHPRTDDPSPLVVHSENMSL